MPVLPCDLSSLSRQQATGQTSVIRYGDVVGREGGGAVGTSLGAIVDVVV